MPPMPHRLTDSLLIISFCCQHHIIETLDKDTRCQRENSPNASHRRASLILSRRTTALPNGPRRNEIRHGISCGSKVLFSWYGIVHIEPGKKKLPQVPMSPVNLLHMKKGGNYIVFLKQHGAQNTERLNTHGIFVLLPGFSLPFLIFGPFFSQKQTSCESLAFFDN